MLLSVTNFIQTPAIKHKPKRTFHALYYKQRLYYSGQSNVNRKDIHYSHMSISMIAFAWLASDGTVRKKYSNFPLFDSVGLVDW